MIEMAHIFIENRRGARARERAETADALENDVLRLSHRFDLRVEQPGAGDSGPRVLGGPEVVRVVLNSSMSGHASVHAIAAPRARRSRVARCIERVPDERRR